MSESLKDVESLLDSEVPEISEAAQKALDLNIRLKAKEISQEEYVDLLEDIGRLENIDRAMYTESVYLAIYQAYAAIIALKTLTSII